MANEEKQMDTDVMELVLKEFLEEQKTTNQYIIELIKKSDEFKEKFKDLETQIRRPQPVIANSDPKPYMLLLQKGFTDIKTIVGKQPKSVVKKFQILLFPEQDAKLFYKIVFGRWIIWLTAMLIINNIYKWGVNYSDNQKDIEIQQQDNDRIKKSWQYLYEHTDKSVQKEMEKAYENSRKTF